MVSTITLMALLSVAAYTDATRHKIYNWTTYPGILAGIAAQTWESGWEGTQDALIGFLACGFVMLACFVLFPDLGGGDVKLIAMMGAALGWEDGILAMLWTFVIGFVAGLTVLIWRQGLVRIVARALGLLREALLFRGRVSTVGEADRTLQRWLLLGPAALLAVIAVRWETIADFLRVSSD